jgi:hypothetical protein
VASLMHCALLVASLMHCALLVASLMHCTTIVSLPRSAVYFVIPEWFASSGIVGLGARCGGGSGGGGTHTLWGSRGGRFALVLQRFCGKCKRNIHYASTPADCLALPSLLSTLFF